MADPRFFTNKGPFPLAELAGQIGATIGDGSDGALQLADVAPLDEAGPADLSFLDNPKYIAAFRATKAAACIVAPDHADKAPAGLALLLCDQPYRAYAQAAQAFYPGTVQAADSFGDCAQTSPQASIHPTAKIAADATVEPGAVIGARAEIGRGTVIAAGAAIAKGCTVGAECFVGSHVSVSHAHIGDRVILHPGARIGQDGFGFAMGLPAHLKVPQLGRVIVQDDVEIGANTTIDRGAAGDTVIGEGTKIDNLVQIGHNVKIGRGCIIVAQTGIAGSARIEDFAVLAARVGIAGHLTIGAGAQFAARSSVIHDVPPGARMGGSPAKPIREWAREVAAVKRLAARRTAKE